MPDKNQGSPFVVTCIVAVVLSVLVCIGMTRLFLERSRLRIDLDDVQQLQQEAQQARALVPVVRQRIRHYDETIARLQARVSELEGKVNK